jgi:EAL domain-containing protein (putative c-di-GMP-specific phosphodiesterase class I)/ActR/RegA family two-component response regulator
MQIAELNFLVAEDDSFQRRWLVVMLTNLGAKNIVEASDGLEALRILQNASRQIDISIIDLNMPEMDGMELIRHLAKENHQTSIIVASALDSALLFSVETMSKAYGVKMLGTISKPATPETLLALFKLYKPPQLREPSVLGIPDFSYEEILEGLKNRQFEPLFQPKVEIATGKVAGAEAFCRWRHPEFGLIRPEAFIPILEMRDEMDALVWAVLEKSADACLRWRELGFPISCSINISPSSLERPGFAEKISDYVAELGMGSNDITVEVTESAAVTNVPYFLENLTRLRMKGFGLSVDDYGAGHSSMQQLLRIPFSELKIDRSFVAGAYQNESMELVLSSSFELCRKLNRQSVAVGVETQQDWNFLIKLGCQFAQGYYIAKPMEADALPAWMAEWSQFF